MIQGRNYGQTPESRAAHRLRVDGRAVLPHFELPGGYAYFGPVRAAGPTKKSPAKDDERGGRTPSRVSRAHAQTLFPSIVHQVGSHARRM